jgi:hypothetical protein
MSLPSFDSEAILQEVAGPLHKRPADGLDVISVFSGVDVACYLSGPISRHLGINVRGPHANMDLSRVMYPGQHFEHEPRRAISKKLAVVGSWRFNDDVTPGTALDIAKQENAEIIALDIMDKGSATTGEIKKKMAEMLPNYEDSAVCSYDFSSVGAPLAGQRCIFVACRPAGEVRVHNIDNCLQQIVGIVQSTSQAKARSLKKYILEPHDDLKKFYETMDAVGSPAGYRAYRPFNAAF